MHLYTMHKRDILLALCGFVCSFILLLLIGLAGPNVARLHSVSASHILSANRVANQTMLTNLMHHGPFVLHSPLVNSYDDHLRLWMTIRLRPVARPGKSTISTTPSSAISAEGDHTETFQKSFPTWLQIIVRQSGDAKSVGQLMLNQWKGPQSSNQSGSYHNLRCFDRQCEPILLVSLEQLDHFAYTIRLGFDQLINAQFAPKIEDIEFTFATLNPTFASLSIWFRLLCLLSTLIISVKNQISKLKPNFFDCNRWISVTLECSACSSIRYTHTDFAIGR